MRRSNNIKTIHAYLAIEDNILSLEQVTGFIDGKVVLGPTKDILEVKNALEVYKKIQKLNLLKEKDLLKVHGLLMKDLVEDNGQCRAGNVGIFSGTSLRHMAPSCKRVPELMNDLFNFIEKNVSFSWLIKSCIFHYELEFIHPFSDGNGRMGRLWQQLLLMQEDPFLNTSPLRS